MSETLQPNLSPLRLAQFAVPLPPLAEQLRIVAEVERRLSVLDALESEVTANLARANRLRQSILKRAFEGKLVPQDPDDELASALLARIQAERKGGKPTNFHCQGKHLDLHFACLARLREICRHA